MNPLSLTNPWVILAIAVILIGTNAATGLWQRHDGAAAVKAAYEHRDNEELQAANKRIHDLEESARATERAQSTALAQIGENHAQELADAEALRRRDVDAARSGALRLRDPGARPCSGGSETAPAPAAPGERDVAQAGELSPKTSEFLVSLADDADTVVVQLTACQGVVRTYLETMKGAAP